jgi:ribonuclease-3
MEKNLFKELQKQIGLTFADERLLEIAFTHPSVRGKSQLGEAESYRRLEFLGDAVLRLVTSEELYRSSNGNVESLHKEREELVPNLVLERVAETLNLRKYLRGSGSSDVLSSQKVLAKIYEALTGAIFLDKGYQVAANFVVQTLVRHIHDSHRSD